MSFTEAVLLLFLLGPLILVEGSNGPEVAIPVRRSENRYKLLSYLANILEASANEEKSWISEDTSNEGENMLTILTWNLLAPIWIDRKSIESRGVVDMNLLNDNVRLNLEIQRVLEQQPDVINLQEIQEDTYSELKNRLSEVYLSAGFAPNVKDYWKSYLPQNVEYKKNGVLTFYKKSAFSLISTTQFETSDAGSVALLSIFRSQNSKNPGRRILILVNCHLESGVSPQEIMMRIIQANAIMGEVQKALGVVEKSYPNESPAVIIAGDFNTQDPFPGYKVFKDNGFNTSSETTGTPFIPTYFYESPLPIPGGNGATTDRSGIDHVFVRHADVTSDRIEVKSVVVPDISSDELTEKVYVEKLTDIFLDALKDSDTNKFWEVMQSDVFTSAIKVVGEGKNSDHNANRALRLGSDHLPMFVKCKLK